MSYRQFLLTNVSSVSVIESALRSLSYFLPGRFEDSEFAALCLQSTVNMISMYHDRIIGQALHNSILLRESGSHRPSLASHHCMSSDVKLPTDVMYMLQNLQLVAELFIRGKKKQPWSLIFFIELTKAFLRLYIVFKTRSVCIQPHISINREYDPSSLSAAAPGSQCVGKRTGIVFPKSINDPNGPNFLSNLKSSGVQLCFTSPKHLLSSLNDVQISAEVIYTLRPLVYAFLLYRCKKHSWIPFLFSLGMDGFSYFILNASRPKHKIPPLEAEEYKRRANLLFLYILRNPLYSSVTSPALENTLNLIEGKLLIGFIAKIIKGYKPLWENTYFFSSGS